MKVVLNDIVKRYGSLYALNGVSAEIPPGRIVSVLGSNGAGKTTLLRCLAGIIVPKSGQVEYDGEQFSRARLDFRRRMAFLPDFPILFPEMTVVRHIGMVLRLYGADGPGVEERVVTALRDFDLLTLAWAPIATLSRGEAYKTGLAALVVLNPELWLLDEPFASGMDPHGIIAFKEYARAAAEAGHTVVYSTQLLDVAEDFSDLVCILDHGEIYAFDSLANLRAAHPAPGGVLERIFIQLRAERS
jgi:ABC-type multidrug transport system ATPase subunit